MVGRVKRSAMLIAVGVVVLAVIGVRTQSNARRTMEQERRYAEILERRADGHVEHYTSVIELMPAPTAPHDRIDWFATAHADLAKPSLVVTFRRVLVPLETWETYAKKPAAFIADGKRLELKPFQIVAGENDLSPVMVRYGGPRSILEAVAGAKSIEIEFGSKARDLGERGLANCRKLLRRSEAATSPNRSTTSQ
jgi:hypothetical protein